MTSDGAGAESFRPISAIHLVLRFFLEIVMVAGVGMLGWELGGFAGAIAFAVAAIALWGVFGTAGDSARGEPVVNTPGPVRLLLELTLFGLGATGIWLVWSRAASETFLTVSVLHYVIMWERLWWLLRGKRTSITG